MTQPKINILFLTCFGHLRGGGQRSLLLLLERLDRERFNPVLAVPDSGEFKEAAQQLGIPVEVLPFPRVRSLAFIPVVRYLSALIRLMRRRQIALVCTDSPRETFYAGLAGKWLSVPVLCHARVSDSKQWLDRVLVALCDRLIAVSEAAAGRFVRIAGAGKVRTVYNGVDVEALRPVPTDFSRPVLKAGFFGRLEYRKGVDTLIKALHLLGESRLEVHIFGDGESGYVASLAQLPGAAGVVFHGFEKDVVSAMSGMDFVVLPSRCGEGLSRSIIEAFALGKPVIASDTPSNPEVLGRDLDRFIFKNGDAQDLARVLRTVLEDRPLLEAAARLVRRRAEQYFDVNRNTASISQIYEELAGIHKILVVDFGGIGDMALAQPGIRALKDFYRQARVMLLCAPRAAAFAREFLPYDDVVEMPVFDAASRRMAWGGWFGLAKILRKLRRQRFDMAINMRSIARARGALAIYALFWAIHARHWVGRDTDGRGFFFDQALKEKIDGDRHEVDDVLGLARLLGAQPQDDKIVLPVDPATKERVREDLIRDGCRGGSRTIVLHVGGTPSRRWPLPLCASAMKELGKNEDICWVVTGGKGEEHLGFSLRRHFNGPMINRIGTLSLGELLGLMAQASLVISNDTGVVHLAAALGTPLVAIFGHAYVARYDPRRLSKKSIVLYHEMPCAPCERYSCRSLRCMEAITPQEVAEAARALL